MATSEGNNEVAPAEMPPNKGETQAVKVDIQQREPMDTDMETNDRETHSADVDMQTKNVGKQPAKVDERTENIEAQQADVDMQPENVETQPTDSKIQPNNEDHKVAQAQSQSDGGKTEPTCDQPNFVERQSVDVQAYNGEKQPTGGQPNNGEALAKEQPNSEETQPADAQPKTEETQPADAQPKSEETQPADARPKNGETHPADAQPKNVKTQQADAQLKNVETQTADAQPKDGETQPVDGKPSIEEAQPVQGQPKDEEKLPANVLPNCEKTLPASTSLNKDETEPADALLINEQKQSADGKTQPEDAKKEAPDAKRQPTIVSTDTEMHPSIGETQPAVAEMHLGDRETQAVNAEMHPNDGQTQPADIEMQPFDAKMQHVNEVVQPSNVESHALEMQANTEGLQPLDAELQSSEMKIETVNEDMQSNRELQPADAHLQPNNGDLQPVHAHVQPDSGGDNQSFYVEFQSNNGEMQLYNPETHSHDIQMQPYNPDLQLHDEQIQPYEMQTQDGQIQPYSPETQPQAGHIEPYNPETQPNKRRKKKSMVWEHFTIEAVSPGCRRALCNRCKQSFAYSTGSKVAGTSHLKRHIAKGTCAAIIPNQEGNQSSPYTPPSSRMRGSVSGTKRRYGSSSSPYVPFDQDRCRQEIAKMIIMHDYPLHMVEQPGFVSFVQNLQPRFDVGSFSTVQGDCIATYLTEKQNISRLVDGSPGRVCLSLDLWTSNHSVGYVVITGHFIDADWKFNRRILNVVMEPYPESDTVLSHALSVCLSEWSLEGKIFSITFNRQLNETGIENLRAYLAVKNPLILNGQLLIGNCIGYTLGCMAKDLLGAGQDIVKKIRDSVKYVKTSDSHVEKFLELKRQLQVPSEKSLSLDDQTKWNTTYEMLLAASELKEVFSCLDTTDPDYKKAPSMEIWKQVETLCTYLKLLYDAANVITNTPNPTPITCFHEVWKIYSELGRAVSSEDPFIVHLTRSMHEQVIKYWKDCSLILAVAVVMDPRFKMKLIEFTFTKLYGEDAPIYVRIVDEGIHELFDEYVALPLPLTPTYAEDGHARDDMRTDEHGELLLSDHGLTDFDMYIMETTSQQTKSEIDQYLEESLLPRVQEIDVLSWWKMNKLKYPTLSKMARDILTTPVCTVTSEAIFNTIPKKMDVYRSTLRPVTVEALICAKNWLQYGPPEVSNTPLKMEL